MRALIVGGCGFVGLNIAEALLRRGDMAVLFDANPLHPEAARAFAALPGAVSVCTGDVRDPQYRRSFRRLDASPRRSEDRERRDHRQHRKQRQRRAEVDHHDLGWQLPLHDDFAKPRLQKQQRQRDDRQRAGRTVIGVMAQRNPSGAHD